MTCSKVRKSYDGPHTCERAPHPRSRNHQCACGVGWNTGSDNFTGDRAKGRAFHAKEKIRVKTHTVMRVLRERAGLSQTELAQRLSRGQPEVSMWEWGKERIPDHIRHQVFGILRQALADDHPSFEPEDLDRPYDEALMRWASRASPAEPG